MTSAFELLKQKNLKIGLCSSGLMDQPHLAAFLATQSPRIVRAKAGDDCDLYIGWGNKKSGLLARRFSGETGRPFLLLEDAFFRSIAPQSVNGERAIGLNLDDRGIYYAADKPSRLERLISQSCGDEAAHSSGAELLAAMAKYQVSKYNNFDAAQRAHLEQITTQKNVLVVDQTFNDQSIVGSGASDASFDEMIKAAIAENPGATIIVKIHPEVMAGKKQGYLKQAAIAHNCLLLSANVNPWDLFEKCQAVYTVSSQLGFEALVAGKKVRCFGTPFYAGWGLTHDQNTHPERAKFKPTLEQLAHAACEKYARYINPFDRTEITAIEAIEQLAFRRDLFLENSNISAFYKISGWKKKRVRQMFMNPRAAIFHRSMKKAVAAAKRDGGALVAWASKIDKSLEDHCKLKQVPLYRLEDGFIRSVGLGANLHLPMSLVLDKQGIYYDSGTPSTLEGILQTHEFPPRLIKRAEKLNQLIVENNISKYNLPAGTIDFHLPKDKRIILVPGQVDNDASVLQSGGGIDSKELLRQVRKACPDDFIIFKPHPDVISGQRPGIGDADQALEYADHFADRATIDILLRRADEVHTLTSQAGFEALQRGKKVVCYGMPFYAGWGLTKDRVKHPRRTTKRSLEELVAATLILYPRYFDPDTSLACGPEIIIERILAELESPTPPSWLIRARRLQGKIKRKLLP